jgi:hypothetical protein
VGFVRVRIAKIVKTNIDSLEDKGDSILKSIIALFSTFLFASPCLAGSSDSFAPEDWDVRLDLMTSAVLSPVIKNKRIEIPTPAPVGSPASLLDYKTALTLHQQDKDDAMMSAIEAGAVYDISETAIDVGMLPAREDAPSFWAIMDEAYLDVSLAGLKAKKSYARIRPVQFSEDFQPLIETPGTPSYPSLIAADMHLFSRVAALIDDQCAAEDEAYATEIQFSRIYAGVSTMTDIQGGISLSDWYIGHLQRSELWHDNITDAVSELTTFHQVHGCTSQSS